MGAYGSPELKSPEYRPKMPQHMRSKYPADMLNVCRCCGVRYYGNKCPNCGTKVGRKVSSLSAFVIFLLGIMVGAFSAITVFFMMGARF
jgi:hypothetical protein